MAGNQGGPQSPIVVNRFDPGILNDDNLDNFSPNRKKNQPYLLDLVTLQRLWFQTIPYSIKNNAESTFVSLASPGRNLPFYNYSGSEKTVQFTISWYSDEDSRQDVILKCRWIESLSMSDGYEEEPHKVQFIFGDLYKNAKWLVKSAPFELSNFNREVGLLPQLATQEVTLIKVQDKNPSRAQNLKYTF